MFFKSPNLHKEIFQKTILNLKFKFQAQDSFLEYFFLWRFEKRIPLSEKKDTFNKNPAVYLLLSSTGQEDKRIENCIGKKRTPMSSDFISDNSCKKLFKHDQFFLMTRIGCIFHLIEFK